VMDEEPRAAEWLERISAGSIEWFNYAGSTLETKPASFDNGAFYESANYASFGLSQYLLFRLAWNNTFVGKPAPPQIATLDRAGDYFINIAYPNSDQLMSLNFGDGSLHVDGSRVMTLLIANGISEPRYLWYLNRVGQQTFREGIDRSTPLGLMYCADDASLAAAPAAPDLPPSAIYRGMGWAVLRSSWDKDATLLAVKSGMTWNHAHADAGSFILFHHGKNLLIDSGNCSYTLPEYDAYYRQSQAHNVVLFNGQGENPEDTYHGSQFPGSVQNLIDVGELKYVWADATGPMSQHFIRNFRHFLWIGDVILIIDDLKAYEPGQFEWLLHFDGKAERQGLDLSIAQDSARLVVRPLFPQTFPEAGFPHDFPEKMQLVEKTGLKDHEPQTKLTYYSLTPAEKTRQTKLITALVLADGDNQPQIERLEDKNMIGVRIRQGGKTTDVYLNLLADGRLRHLNSTLSVNGWETDAYLTAIAFPDSADATNPDAATRYFIAQGSYLRRDGKVVLDSLSKVFATWQTTAAGMTAQIQGQPTINARIRAAKQPAEVSLNGQRIAVPYDDALRMVTLGIGPEQKR
jgi:oligo-alginate lyase